MNSELIEIHFIGRAPQVHIQRSVPNAVRFASFLNNHLQNHMSRSASATPTTNASSQPARSATPSSQTNSNAGNLNDAQLNTSIPIFGSNDVQLQIRDLVNVFPPPSTLNRIRTELREYLMEKLCLSTAPNEENVATVNIFNPINHNIRPLQARKKNSK